MSNIQPTVFVVQPGAYLFQGPTVLGAEVGKNLLVVFAAPFERVCAVVLSDGNSSRKILEDMLDNGFQSLVEKLSETSEIQCKIFGAGYGNLQPLDSTVAWIENHGLSIVAKDVGRSVNRTITLLCDSGRAGVQYGGAPQESLAELIPRGTARSRLQVPSLHEALVLTTSPVTGQLIRQAVEEHPSWRATVPSDPLPWLARNVQANFRWDLVLFVEDWSGEDTAPWMQRIAKIQAETQFLWAGDPQPNLTGQHLIQLPKPDPENQTVFKQALLGALIRPAQPLKTKQSQK